MAPKDVLNVSNRLLAPFDLNQVLSLAGTKILSLIASASQSRRSAGHAAALGSHS
jgi:hypothetical protein